MTSLSFIDYIFWASKSIVDIRKTLRTTGLPDFPLWAREIFIFSSLFRKNDDKDIENDMTPKVRPIFTKVQTQDFLYQS